jgi:hypothetical protein
MLERFAIASVLYIAGGLPLAYMVITSSPQMPWLIALGIYFVGSALVSNWYVFFGGRPASLTKVLGWLLLNGAIAVSIALGYLIVLERS